MDYHTKYPASFPEDEVEACIKRVDRVAPCSQCGQDTEFMDTNFDLYVCSDGCEKRLLKKVLAEINGS